MRLFYAFSIILIISSCATVRKHKTSEQTTRTTMDTASLAKEFSRETTITEMGSERVTVFADSASTSGTVSSQDTTEHSQETETEMIYLKTTIKPQIKDGKVTGYDVNSKATVKPKIIDIPINKTTTIKEKSTEQQSSKTATSDIKRVGLSFWGVLGILAGLILVALLLFYKYVRK